jgi:16S rRNA (cytidine1402-2'-O)-methyltransferase
MIKKGKVTVGAVPIGNILDISFNLINQVRDNDIIVVESLEGFKTLNLTTKSKILVYPEYGSSKDIEKKFIDNVIDKVISGENLLLLSDAGTPALVDPGYWLINEAIKKNIKVDVMPGPNSVIPAFVLSNLHPKGRFYFYGFVKENRINEFKKLINISDPIIFFATNDHLESFLSDAIQVFGKNARAAVCANLSHVNELIIRDTLINIYNQRGKISFYYSIIIEPIKNYNKKDRI